MPNPNGHRQQHQPPYRPRQHGQGADHQSGQDRAGAVGGQRRIAVSGGRPVSRYRYRTFRELQKGDADPRQHGRRHVLRHAGEENRVGGTTTRQRHQLSGTERLQRLPQHKAPLPQRQWCDVLPHGTELPKRRTDRSAAGTRSRTAVGGILLRL